MRVSRPSPCNQLNDVMINDNDLHQLTTPPPILKDGQLASVNTSLYYLQIIHAIPKFVFYRYFYKVRYVP